MKNRKTLLHGPYQTGLEKEVFEKAESSSSRTPGSILFVARTSRRARNGRERWREAGYSPLRLSSTTLKGIAERGFERVEGPSQGLGSQLERRLVEEAVDDLTEEIGVPEPVAPSGLVDEFSQLFTRFEEARLTAPVALSGIFSSLTHVLNEVSLISPVSIPLGVMNNGR